MNKTIARYSVLRLVIFTAAFFLLALGCRREDVPSIGPDGDSMPSIRFTPKMLPFEGEEEDAPETKAWSTRYTDAAEDLLVDQSVGIYDKNGVLFTTYYYNYQAATDGYYDDDGQDPSRFDSEFKSPQFIDGDRYTVYMIVNSRGDKRSLFPQSESLLSSVVLRLDDPLDIATTGIPMAGSKSFYADTQGSREWTSVDVPVRRLYAKVHFDVPTLEFVDYSPSGNGYFSINNINTRLCPFGESKALAASDIYSGMDADGGGHAFSEGWFYVPENKQGNVAGISTPADKALDKTPAICGYSTIVSVVVGFNDGDDLYYPVSGETSYKSFLGENATTNFDVNGNCVYNVSYTVTEGTLVQSSWKVWNGSTWTRYKYRLTMGNDVYEIWAGENTTGTASVGVGQSIPLNIERQAWRYSGGQLIDEARPWTELPNYYSNTVRYIATIATPREYGTSYTIDINGKSVIGKAAGDLEFAYFCMNDKHRDGNVFRRTAWTINFHVFNTYSTMYRYVMEVENNMSSVDIGDYVRVRIARYTDNFTNGELTSSGTTPTYVSPSLFNWTTSDSGIATVSAESGNWMKVTGVNVGSVRITATLASPTSADENDFCTSDFTVESYSWGWTDPGDGGQTDIEFGTREVYRYVLESTSGTTQVQVNQTITLRVARYVDTYSDGVLTNTGTEPTYMPSSLFNWLSGGNGIAEINEYSDYTVTVRGVNRGTVPITATLKQATQKDWNTWCRVSINVID